MVAGAAGICTLPFLALSRDPVTGSAIVFAAVGLASPALFLLGIHLWQRDRDRVFFIDETRFRYGRIFFNTPVAANPVTMIRWEIGPYAFNLHGSLTLESGELAVDFADYEPSQHKNLIAQIRALAPFDRQLGWEAFKTCFDRFSFGEERDRLCRNRRLARRLQGLTWIFGLIVAFAGTIRSC